MSTGWGLGPQQPVNYDTNDRDKPSYRLPPVRSTLVPPAAVTTQLSCTGYIEIPGSTVGLFQSRAIQCNDLWNPFKASENFAAPNTTHQPRFYDQWVQFYGSYAVFRSRARFTFMPQAGAGTEAWQTLCFAYVLHTSETATVDPFVVLEYDRVVSRLVTPTTSSGSQNCTTIDLKWNVLGEEIGLEYYGQVITTSGAGAATGATPTFDPKFQFGVVAVNSTGGTGGTSPATLVRCDISYDCIFYNDFLVPSS